MLCPSHCWFDRVKLTGGRCRYDFFGHAEQVIGQHSAPIRTVEFLRDTGLVVTGLQL